MKKILLTLALLFMIIILTGCTATTIDAKGIERKVTYGRLVEIHSVDNGKFKICYDPTTMICYMVLSSPYRLGVSPYYVVGDDGKPEIAVYGTNYN